MENLSLDWLMSDWLLAPCAVDPEAFAVTCRHTAPAPQTTIYSVDR